LKPVAFDRVHPVLAKVMENLRSGHDFRLAADFRIAAPRSNGCRSGSNWHQTAKFEPLAA